MTLFAASDPTGLILVAAGVVIVLAIAYGYYSRGKDKDVNQRPQGADQAGAGKSRISSSEAETSGAFDSHGTKLGRRSAVPSPRIGGEPQSPGGWFSSTDGSGAGSAGL